MTDLDEGRPVVVGSRKGRVLMAGDMQVRVSYHEGGNETVPRERVRKWPRLDIDHPLPAGTRVDALPPGEGTALRATVRVVGSSPQGLAYTVQSARKERGFTVGPEAIVDVKSSVVK